MFPFVSGNIEIRGKQNSLFPSGPVIKCLKLKATWLTRVLKRQTNCGKVVIKGKPVNRGGDFGREVPCEYIFEDGFLSCECMAASEG